MSRTNFQVRPTKTGWWATSLAHVPKWEGMVLPPYWPVHKPHLFLMPLCSIILYLSDLLTYFKLLILFIFDRSLIQHILNNCPYSSQLLHIPWKPTRFEWGLPVSPILRWVKYSLLRYNICDWVEDFDWDSWMEETFAKCSTFAPITQEYEDYWKPK